jgi:hypothetical protein
VFDRYDFIPNNPGTAVHGVNLSTPPISLVLLIFLGSPSCFFILSHQMSSMVLDGIMRLRYFGIVILSSMYVVCETHLVCIYDQMQSG